MARTGVVHEVKNATRVLFLAVQRREESENAVIFWNQSARLMPSGKATIICAQNLLYNISCVFSYHFATPFTEEGVYFNASR